MKYTALTLLLAATVFGVTMEEWVQIDGVSDSLTYGDGLVRR